MVFVNMTIKILIVFVFHIVQIIKTLFIFSVHFSLAIQKF